MRLFQYEKMADFSWDSEILSYVAKIHEYKGKQELYIRQKPVELQRLLEIAEVQSTEASNRIEGIVTTNARLKQLIEDTAIPRNRNEKEILGYRNILKTVHESYDAIPVQPNFILQLHRDLLRFSDLSYGGKYKTAQNEIDKTYSDGSVEVLFKPLSPFETPDAIQSICDSYQKTAADERIDPLVVIPCFILDFLCIHPFSDGNGRLSRILTLLLLYRSGYTVGKYVSIEKAIADTKEAYYEALFLSDQRWHEEENDPKPFIKYMLGIILSCYRDFEQRMKIAEQSGVKHNAYDVVKSYVLNTIGLFSKTDVLIACPSLGSSSAEASLKKLKENGIIERIGKGPTTKYVRKDAFEKI